MKYLLALSLVLSTTTARADIRENGGRLASAAAEIEFFSPGNGIDRDLKADVDEAIAFYKNAGKVSEYTEKRWGREGEITLCVKVGDIWESRRLNQQLQELVARGQGKTRIKFIASCIAASDANSPFRLK